MGSRQHLTEAEWSLLSKQSWKKVKHLTEVSLDKFEDVAFLNVLKGTEKTYSDLLAFHQRISYPMEYALKAKLLKNRFPNLEEVENFKIFFKKADDFFSETRSLDKNNISKKYYYSKYLTSMIISLWCSGYGIYQGLNKKVINDVLLIRISSIADLDNKRKYAICRISEIMERDQNSPVTKSLNKKWQVPDSKLVLEWKNWQAFIEGNQEGFVTDICNYLFCYLIHFVENSSEIIENDLLGDTKKIRLNNHDQSVISFSTWSNYSLEYRAIAKLFCQYGYTTTEDIMFNGVDEILKDKATEWSKRKIKHFKHSLRKWLSFHISYHELKVSINQVIPRSIRRTTREYGKILNLGKAYTLIEALLDEQNPAIDENIIMDFRYRRACLLQISTGSRAKAICLLLKNCLVKDHTGQKWLKLHKTKGGKQHTVKVNEDAIEWIEELKGLSPTEKIYAPRNTKHFGDGLTEYRLFANANDNGQLTVNGLNKFLHRLQKRIWPDMSQDEHFTSHDFRRLHVIYMVIRKKRRDEIQDQIGHNNPNSLIPYLATTSPEVQEAYAKIYKEGVWKNISDQKEEETDIELVPLLSKSKSLTETDDLKVVVNSLVQTVMSETEEFEVSDHSFLPVNNVSAGFPRYTHNCTAHELLNCGHTELHCFNCDYYRGDSEMFDDHIAELFRYMLLILQSRESVKKKRDGLERELVTIRAEDISELLDESIPKLLKSSFGKNDRQVEKIKNELWEKSSKYWRKYGKSKPALTFQEAKRYLETGEVNG